MRTEANNRRSLLVTASVMLILDLIVLYFRPWDQLSLFGMVPLALVLTWSLWILGLGSRSTKLVATVIFWVIASVVLATMALQLSGAVPNPAGPGRYNAGPYIMLMILCILAYLVFSTRSGLRASLGILVATVLLNLAWVTDRAVAGELAIPIATVVIYEGLLGVTILLLHGLAQSKDEHAVALLEAERMRSMAYQDSLTGLPNRRMLEEALSRWSSLAERREQAVSVIFFDVDHFKQINDTYSHTVGDSVLEEIARLVRSLLRTSDLLGRWGGEEFVILAPHTELGEAVGLAERVREGVERHAFPGGVRATASFGVASDCEPERIRELVGRASVLLHEAKRAGRNRVLGLS